MQRQARHRHAGSSKSRSLSSSSSGGGVEVKIRRDLRAFFEPLRHKPHSTAEVVLCANWAEVVDAVRGASLVLREVYRSRELLPEVDEGSVAGEHGFLDLHDIPNVPEDALHLNSNSLDRVRAQLEAQFPEISLTSGKVSGLLRRMQDEYTRLEQKFETSKHAIRKLTRRLCELSAQEGGDGEGQREGEEGASPTGAASSAAPGPASAQEGEAAAHRHLEQENAALRAEVQALREERELLLQTLQEVQPGGVTAPRAGAAALGTEAPPPPTPASPPSRKPTGKTRHLKLLLRDRTSDLLDAREQCRKAQRQLQDARLDWQRQCRAYLQEHDRCVFRTQLLLQRAEDLANSPGTLANVIQPQKDVTPSVSTANILEQVNSVLKQQLLQATEDLVHASDVGSSSSWGGGGGVSPEEGAVESEAAPSSQHVAPWTPQGLGDRMHRLTEQMDVQRTKELVALVVELRRRFSLLQSRLADTQAQHEGSVESLQQELEVLARERDALACTVQELSVHPLPWHEERNQGEAPFEDFLLSHRKAVEGVGATDLG